MSCRARYWIVLGWLVSGLQVGPVFADLGVPVSDPLPVKPGSTSLDQAAHVATDGNGNWLAVWHSEDTLGGTIGSDADILFARSIDNGQNWSLPAPLNIDATTDARQDQSPRIAANGNGNWVAVWHAFGGGQNDTDTLTARSIDNGANWSAPIPLNKNADNDSGFDGYPDVLSNGAGLWIAVWHSSNNLGNNGTDGDIFFTRSTDNGATWSAPAVLNTDGDVDGKFDQLATLATDRQGHWIVAWTRVTFFPPMGPPPDADVLYARSIDNGLNWSAPAPLNANGNGPAGEFGPSIATDGQGHWVAAWDSDPNNSPPEPDREILVSRSLDNGASWSFPVALNVNAPFDFGEDSNVVVATDNAGNWVAVWQSNENLGGELGIEGDILVARSVNNGASWSLPSPLNTNAATDNGTDFEPQLATDGHGNWLVVWNRLPAYDVPSARFALPDCNLNLIADSTETLLGLLPDINFNGVPDICEIIAGPPPGPANGCGVGLCGAGVPTFAPLTLLGFAWMRGVRRRKRSITG